jgi:predicted transcriptional regulator
MKATPEHILISVESRYVLKMLNGSKTAEIRRRPLKIEPGTCVWVYSKLPSARIEIVAIAEQIITATPEALWALYKERIAIERSEFLRYIGGASRACVVLLQDMTPVCPPLKLEQLRRQYGSLHAPQFFKRLGHGPELARRFSSAH